MHPRNQRTKPRLVHQLVLEFQLLRNNLIEQHSPNRRLDEFFADAEPDRLVNTHVAHLVVHLQAIVLPECARPLLPFGQFARISHVVAAQHHIQRRCHHWLTVRRRQQIFRTQQHLSRLGHRFVRQRHMNRHLVAVEVRVVGEADQRV